jgi:hypothetical protein
MIYSLIIFNSKCWLENIFYLLLNLSFLIKCSGGTYGMKDYRLTHCWYTLHVIPMTSVGVHYACHTRDICWCTLRTSYPWPLLVDAMYVILWPLSVTSDIVINPVTSIADLILQYTKNWTISNDFHSHFNKMAWLCNSPF